MTKDDTQRDARSFDLWKKGSDAEDADQIEAAISFYIQAGRLKNTDALNNLAIMYDNVLVPPRRKEAVLLYKKAVNLGSEMAAWNLAMHYET